MQKDLNYKIKQNKQYLDKVLCSISYLVEAEEYEAAANYLHEVARFGWGNCTGYYTNWKLEGLGVKIGHSIFDRNRAKNGSVQKRGPIENMNSLKVLHVASSLHAVGGHTRLLLNWIRTDTERPQEVVITRQHQRDLPLDLIKSFKVSTSIFSSLNAKNNTIEKAIELRNLSRNFDLIILHIHPDDIIPVIAFSVDNVPPIAFINHADHIFWIGSPIIDMLIQIRESNIKIDQERRSISNQTFLPIPLSNIIVTSDEEYIRCREKIKIVESQIMLLSIGDEYKYYPFKDHNFFEAMIDVLNESPNAILFMVGILPTSTIAEQYSHQQIRFLGRVEDTSLYEKATDIYIEGFPISSFTAMLQVGLRGKLIQLMPHPLFLTKIFAIDSNCFTYPRNAIEWKKQLMNYISNPECRSSSARIQLEYLSSNYSVENWKSTLNGVYEKLIHLKHTIKTNNFSKFYCTANELNLSNQDLKLTINHLSPSLYKLTLLQKIKHLFILLYTKPDSVIIRKKSILKFLLKKGL